MTEETNNGRVDPDGPAGYLSYGDALFRKRRKSGWAIVPTLDPVLERPVADTHAHLSMLSDPSLSLARCGVIGVDFVCTVVDPAEGEDDALRLMPLWREEAQRRIPEVLSATEEHLAEESDLGWAATFAAKSMVSLEVSSDSRPVPRAPHLRALVGVHPHNAKCWSSELEARLLLLLANPIVSAVGEVGLDYHYDLSPRAVQREVFARQVEIAHQTGLPVSLHVRDAHADAFAILEEVGWPTAGALLHCCSVGPEELSRWLDRGCHVAFGGAVTFAKSEELRESAKLVPEGRLLTETDAPYMAPVPFRGIECGPEFSALTAVALAELRGALPGEKRCEFLARAYDSARMLLDGPLTDWQASQAVARPTALEACRDTIGGDVR